VTEEAVLRGHIDAIRDRVAAQPSLAFSDEAEMETPEVNCELGYVVRQMVARRSGLA
jgi:hypothetical protein